MKKNSPQKIKKNIVQLRLIQNEKQPAKKAKLAAVNVQSQRSETSFRNNVNVNQLASDAFILMRLNEFEVLEETFGHAIAKELIGLVNDRLRNCLRYDDAIERINNKEFAIIISNIESRQYIESLVKRIETQCNGEYLCFGHKLFMTVTAGVSISTQHSTLYDEHLRFARIALRHTECKTCPPLQFFSPDMLDDLQQRARIICQIRQALKQENFVLHYQPQYSVDSEETVAVEALIRLQGQDGELIYPDSFIDLAEESDLILPIGHWVIHTACQQYRQWQDMGCAPHHIAVNISSKQLVDYSLIDTIDEAIQKAGIEYCNLEIEITEQSLIQHITKAEGILAELSAKGVRIALDDFGTGYSSLAYLGQLPLNVLKIDRSFLQQMEQNNRWAGLIRAVVYIANELDLEVVAEGVENKAQHKFIKSVGCHLGQGYGHCRPQNAENIVSMLQPRVAQANHQSN